MFSCEFCEISKNTFFYRTTPGDCFCIYKFLYDTILLYFVYLPFVFQHVVFSKTRNIHTIFPYSFFHYVFFYIYTRLLFNVFFFMYTLLRKYFMFKMQYSFNCLRWTIHLPKIHCKPTLKVKFCFFKWEDII